MRTELLDFTDASAVLAWTAIDDGIMGGISRSNLEHDPAGHAAFKATVSLERNAGVASVRSRPADRSQVGATMCLVEMRGNVKQFKLSMLNAVAEPNRRATRQSSAIFERHKMENFEQSARIE